MAESNCLYVFQKGFNYSQDGPGNRLIYHLSGCNLFCPWCSNPEGMTFDEKSAKLTPAEALAEALSAKMIFIDSGGVTFTGGEVSCQKDAVLEVIKLLKENGIHTCIETNASIGNCDELFSEVDYMIADFKSPNKDHLKAFTGASLETIKSNLLKRAELKKSLLVRIPLINGFNNDEKSAIGFADFFSELKNAGGDSVKFEILAYHEYGKEKWDKLKKPYSFKNGFVNDDDISLLKKALLEYSITTINT